MTAVCEDQGSNLTTGNCVYHDSHCDIQPWASYRLHTLSAVSRSTQPVALRETVKWVSAYRLSNSNKWRWWMWVIAGQVTWLGWRVSGHLAFSLHSSNKPGELSQWPRHDDSAINTIIGIIIISLISTFYWSVLVYFCHVKTRDPTHSLYRNLNIQLG